MGTISTIVILSTISFILNTMIKFAAGAEITPQEFKEFANLQDSLKLFNETFWNNNYGTVIINMRKLGEGPGNLDHLQLLKSLYTHLIIVVKDMETDYSTKGFTPFGMSENRQS